MYTEEELLEALDILIEDYGLTEEEALEIIEETFMDDIEDTYTDLKKKHPVASGAFKGLVYSTTGPLGGLAYGIHKKHRAEREGRKPATLGTLRKVGKGFAYGLVTPPVAGAVGAATDYMHKDKDVRKAAKAELKKQSKEKRKAAKDAKKQAKKEYKESKKEATKLKK